MPAARGAKAVGEASPWLGRRCLCSTRTPTWAKPPPWADSLRAYATAHKRAADPLSLSRRNGASSNRVPNSESKKSGGSQRNRTRNDSENKREIVFAEDQQQYAKVGKRLGDGRFEVTCLGDGQERMGHVLVSAAPAAPAARLVHTPTCSFVCIVALDLGYRSVPAGLRNVPHVLLMGHRQHQQGERRRWGFPGGQRDRRDNSTRDNAVREFAEEFLGIHHPNAGTMAYIAHIFNGNGYTLRKVVDTNARGYSAWALVVPSAKQFEHDMSRVRGATSNFRTLSIDQKYHQQLSNETKGYFWAPLHRAPPNGQWVLHTTRQTAPVVPHRRPVHYRAVAPPIANIQPLRLRAGTLGLALRRTLDMLP